MKIYLTPDYDKGHINVTGGETDYYIDIPSSLAFNTGEVVILSLTEVNSFGGIREVLMASCEDETITLESHEGYIAVEGPFTKFTELYDIKSNNCVGGVWYDLVNVNYN